MLSASLGIWKSTIWRPGLFPCFSHDCTTILPLLSSMSSRLVLCPSSFILWLRERARESERKHEESHFPFLCKPGAVLSLTFNVLAILYVQNCWPISYCKLLYEMGQDFLDRQYVALTIRLLFTLYLSADLSLSKYCYEALIIFLFFTLYL